jgi:two-component system chemotaxis response regulator CheB
VALSYREKAIGVVLTGNLDDGTIGLQAIKAYGGVALVQDPEEADAADMPKSALQHVEVDDCLTLDAIADRLVELARSGPRAERSMENSELETEARFDLRERSDIDELRRIARPSEYTCPECHGALWEVKNMALPHFRCHTGHAYTPQGLSSAQNTMIEEALWAAVRALHEKQMLMQRHARSAAQAERHEAATEHNEAAKALSRQSEILRRMIGGDGGARAETRPEKTS